MAENLTPADVEAYTKGRLPADDDETLNALNRALARARHFCGWHVSPVETHIITVDGTGSSTLFVPSMKIVSVGTVTEEGVEIPDVRASASAPGVLAKKDWQPWKFGYSNVTVELEHGLTALEAEDFRDVILSLIDQATLSIGTGRSGPMISKRVDDVHYNWSGLPRAIDNAPMDKSILSRFQILPI